MNTTWQTESGSLECRWSGLVEHRPYTTDSPVEGSAKAEQSAFMPLPDFAAHSPFGSGEWFVPWNARLRVLNHP